MERQVHWLLAWLTQREGVTALLGDAPGLSEDTTAQQARWGTARNDLQSRPEYTTSLPMIFGLTLFVWLWLIPICVQAQTSSSFSCPDISEKEACDSYSELVQAADKGVTSQDAKYVCFRDYADEFFVMQISNPYLSSWDWYNWNKKLAQYALKDWRQLPQPKTYSSIQTYSGGVENDSTMPSIFLLGSWRPLGGDLLYQAHATHYNSRMKKELLDPNTLLILNADQVEFDETYTSQAKTKVHYSLILQRSTKRFHENFHAIDQSKNLSDSSGRCVQLRPFPSIPDPPTLTEEQEAEQEKLEYCATPSDPDPFSEADRKAYCASSFIHRDDYLAARRKNREDGTKK